MIPLYEYFNADELSCPFFWTFELPPVFGYEIMLLYILTTSLETHARVSLKMHT